MNPPVGGPKIKIAEELEIPLESRQDYGRIAAQTAKQVILQKIREAEKETISAEYSLEYGTGIAEIHKDAIQPGQNVLIVDDLIATSGTMCAACDLVSKLKGEIVECASIVELDELGGRNKLEDKGHKLFSIVNFREDES